MWKDMIIGVMFVLTVFGNFDMNKDTYAYTLAEISKRSYYEQVDFKIISTRDQKDITKSFWFSAHHNVDAKIFSPRDINSYWLIIDTSSKYKVNYPYGEKTND